MRLVISILVSKTLKIAVWTDENDKMTDMEVLEEAYKRDLVSEEQFEESVERGDVLD
jgi:predicted RNA-binding protein associated with RNAse of E/G family